MAKASTGKKKAKATGKSVPAKAKASAKAKPAPRADAKAKSAAPVKKAQGAAKAAPAKASAAPATKKLPAAKPARPKKAEAGSADVKRIAAGATAPSFALKDQTGTVVSSTELKGKPYVLYFYPKDDTTGCTREACGFRDSRAAFGKHGTRVIGVSPDSEASHAKFAGKYGLPFTLLSDPDKVLAKAYGAWGMKKNYGRDYMGIIRSTFVVDAAGKVKRAYYGVKVDGHVDSVLRDVAS
jgi:thioredoxin-dependent peroxiredoxin